MKVPAMNIKFFRKNKRKIAATKLLLFITYLFAPNVSFALTGGPSQPEVQSFEPIGTSDMVDLFTGDFTYNLPLMDVEGYPINLSYHSGITMDQEASWVGLGWNVNPGVINRSIKGIPDDFNGDPITKEMGMKKNWTAGVSGSLTTELFGLDFVQVGYTLGLKYNNYRGVGFEQGLNLALNSGDACKGPLTGNLGINSSSDEGLTIQPSIGLSNEVAGTDRRTADASGTKSAKIGASFNSRSGLKALTISVTQNKVATSLIGTLGTAFNFGGSTYTPSQQLPMLNHSFSGEFHTGISLYGVDASVSLSGYFSSQALATNNASNPAYGVMNLQNGQGNNNAILDFNREKDGSFTTSTPSLPLTNLTNDMFSVMGQGVGGSYRTFRGDVGYVFDPYTYSSSTSADFGLELSGGGLAHFGGDVNVTQINTRSGVWDNDNSANGKLKFKSSANNSLYEPVYFKEANEKSVSENDELFNQFGGFEPKQLKLTSIDDFNYKVEDKLAGSGDVSIAVNTKKNREKRAQVFSYLTRAQVDLGLGLQTSLNLSPINPDKAKHIAEVSVVGTDGKRYVYGIAAYNNTQEEVSFATDALGSGGLVTYNANEASTSNPSGRDGYYSKITTPPFAHSYLLTAILSSDYVDSENFDANTQGPSEGDLGTYVLFKYERKINAYGWKTPVGERIANYNEGLKSDLKDQKGSYIYGTKEIWYNKSIQTKNYIATFEYNPRNDAKGVTNFGTVDPVATPTVNKMYRLDKITLFAKDAVGTGTIKIKDVNFEYDPYSLCKGVNNNLTPNQGKLTLSKVYFTYQNSARGKFSPYVFSYSATNPNYNIQQYDRWGNYQLNGVGEPPNAEYPYTSQVPATANTNAEAWTLKEIKLPSGGTIDIGFEADQYAYVQNKKAGQMFKIAGVLRSDGVFINGTAEISTNGDKNRRLLIGPIDNDVLPEKYMEGINDLYFRCLSNFQNGNLDYVSGYAKIDTYDNIPYIHSDGLKYIKIALRAVKLKDNESTADYNPIAKAGAQFCRLNLPEIAFATSLALQDGGAIAQTLDALISTWGNVHDAFQGPNKSVYNKNLGNSIVCGKSWVRLNAPITQAHAKYGGGARVKEIRFSDNWNTMTGGGTNGEKESTYGQTYSYNLEDGTSSGVASWEPEVGSDENSWHTPVSFDIDGVNGHLVPDDQSYMEEPFGESFFPSPIVGYSRVVVKNLTSQLPVGATLKRHGTGFTVHEFYTTREFPTIAKRTDPEIHQEKTHPFSLASLFHFNVKDYLTASQGFVIETNDMHGKPKGQKVYQEGANLAAPISTIEYKYKRDLTGPNTFRLNNQAKVVDAFGNVSDKNIGIMYDIVADMRESSSETDAAGLMNNIDAFIVIIVLGVPISLGKIANEKTQFRSAGLTKVIQRFGILEETIATDLSSVISTKNLAYDAETGEAILTQTANDFRDPMYTMNYPAHWNYEAMGSAYKNISYVGSYTYSGLGMAAVTDARKFFTPGDEIIVQGPLNFNKKGWIVDVQQNSITAMDAAGNPITNSSALTTQVIRSGRKNQQAEKMASITTYANPLYSLSGNAYQQVVQASAVEFRQEWAPPCNCADNILTEISGNPYVNGSKGNWRVNKSYSYLAGRNLSSFNDNVNTKKDGFFTSFNPFYYVSGNQWLANPQNWTYASEVTNFDINGQEVENRDALGRYSSALFSYNNTMNIATAANAKYNQIATENFEAENTSAGVTDCFDQHLKLNTGSGATPASEGHTGRKSLKIPDNAVTNPFYEAILALPNPCANSTETEQEIQLNLSCLTTTITPIQYLDIVNIFGGYPPYQVNWVVNSGPNLPVLISNNSINLGSTGAFHSVTVTVQDTQGNTTTETFTKP